MPENFRVKCKGCNFQFCAPGEVAVGVGVQSEPAALDQSDYRGGISNVYTVPSGI